MNQLFKLIGLFLFLVMKIAFSNVQAPPNEGNFSLSASQEVGPLFSFGQTLIGKNVLQAYIFPSCLKVTRGNYTQLGASLLYGVTDDLAVMLTLPWGLSYADKHNRSSGLGDVSVQGEYAIYSMTNADYETQATLVASLSLPTGSALKNPPTGYGSTALFGGFTYNRYYVNWLWFISPGVLVTTTHDGIHSGQSYFYQAGLSHTISVSPGKYIFSGLLELDGQYSDKNRYFKEADPDSGGTVIFLSPSLWWSNKNYIIQLGVSVPIAQHLNGAQSKNEYYLLLSLGVNLYT